MSPRTRRQLGTAVSAIALVLSLYTAYLQVQDHAGEAPGSNGSMLTIAMVVLVVGLGLLISGKEEAQDL